MSVDPNEAAAAQLGQLGADTRDRTASDQDEVAAAAAGSAGLGVTEGDLAAILDRIKQMEATLAAQQATIAAAAADARGGPHPLIDHANTVTTLAAVHGDPRAAELAADLAEASNAAAESGDGSYVARIAARLHRHLITHAPPPGENWAYNRLLEHSGVHVPAAVDDLQPPPSGQVAVASDRAPAKVVAGTVVG